MGGRITIVTKSEISLNNFQVSGGLGIDGKVLINPRSLVMMAPFTIFKNGLVHLVIQMRTTGI